MIRYYDPNLINDDAFGGYWEQIPLSEFKGESENFTWAFDFDHNRVYYRKITDPKKIKQIIETKGKINVKN